MILPFSYHDDFVILASEEIGETWEKILWLHIQREILAKLKIDKHLEFTFKIYVLKFIDYLLIFISFLFGNS